MKNKATRIGGIMLAIAPQFLIWENESWAKFVSGVLFAVGGVLVSEARSNKVTSEQVGAK